MVHTIHVKDTGLHTEFRLYCAKHRLTSEQALAKLLRPHQVRTE
jgi:hypothetical protein